MDAGRFDALSKSLARRRSRRSLGAGGLAAGLLAALGVEPASAAAKPCSLTILATTATGKHAKKTYSGALTLQIGDGGAIDSGRFDLEDGTRLALVGQATGRALNLRITLADQTILALEGTAANDLILCRGGASGSFGGPDAADLGTWRTVDGTSTSSGGGTTSGGSAGNGASGNSGGATGGNSGGATSGGSGNTAGNGSGGNSSSSGGGNAAGGSNCASGVVCAGVCCQAAPGLTPDTIVCNAGACECAYSCAAAGCPGGATGSIVTTCGSDPQPHCHSECNPPANGCGAVACDPGSTLNPSTCACEVASCANGLTLGDNNVPVGVPAVCMDTQNDPANCGGCGKPCNGLGGPGGSCVGGVCTGAGGCGGADLLHDAANCGVCGVVCGSGFCQNGVCAAADPCPQEGRTNCNSLCLDTQTDPANCGGCGIACNPGEVCFGGACGVVSDRARKTALAPMDARAVLAGVAGLPIATWRYREEPDGVRHLGPMAQDFASTFGLGGDGRVISTVDGQGVALAAIQGLESELRQLRARLEELERRTSAGTCPAQTPA